MKIAILLLLVMNSAFAWSPKTIEHWNKFSSVAKEQLTDAPFATFWGGFRRALHWPSHKGGMVSIKPTGFRDEVPVYIQSSNKKKDLYLFYPGVFGRPDGLISPSVIDQLEKKDVHVAVIPNLIAPTYLSARPEPTKTPFEFELSNQRAMYKEVIQKIGRENIGIIHVIAESLGSTQALIALIPEENKKIEISSLTLMWPPLYLDRSLKRFDQLIGKSVEQQKKCTMWWKWPSVYFETKMKPLPVSFNTDDRSCLGTWAIAYGFVGGIRRTSKNVFENRNKPTDKLPETFGQFVEMVMPEFHLLIKNSDPRISADHLLSHYKELGENIRIVSSQNDFLNDPLEWETLRKSHPFLESNIYLFSLGGHSGPAGQEDFFDLVLPEIAN